MKANSKLIITISLLFLSTLAMPAQVSNTQISPNPKAEQTKNKTANIGRKAYLYELEDQYKSIHRWFVIGKKPQIYVVSDRVGFEFSENWAAPLKEHFESKGVTVNSVVSLSDIKPFMKGYFRNQFKSKYTNPILLDWDGKFSSHYNCQPGVSNVIFIDSTLTVKYQISGNGVAEQVRDAINQIDKALEPKEEKK